MSKRHRRPREDARPADHQGKTAQFDEPKLTVSGEAYAHFDAWLDSELDGLESRWIHLAAPGATTVRRVTPKDIHPASGT